MLKSAPGKPGKSLTPPGRPVYSEGPIIRAVEIASVITGLCAIAALVFALISFEGRIDRQSLKLSEQALRIGTIQDSRQRSALDGCRIDTAVILRSAANGPDRYPVTSLHGHLIGYIEVGSLSKREKAAHTFLVEVGLGDCKRYARLARIGRLRILPPDRQEKR